MTLKEAEIIADALGGLANGCGYCIAGVLNSLNSALPYTWVFDTQRADNDHQAVKVIRGNR